MVKLLKALHLKKSSFFEFQLFHLPNHSLVYLQADPLKPHSLYLYVMNFDFFLKMNYPKTVKFDLPQYQLEVWGLLHLLGKLALH